MKIYKTYMFRDKDPVIDQLRTAIKDAGIKHSQIARDSGVSNTTLHNWFSGPTKRPQFASVQATAKAIGYELRLTYVGQVRNLRVVRGGKRA